MVGLIATAEQSEEGVALHGALRYIHDLLGAKLSWLACAEQGEPLELVAAVGGAAGEMSSLLCGCVDGLGAQAGRVVVTREPCVLGPVREALGASARDLEH